jgi:N-acetyl-anhydromuramyl-L-alanine amidase AmpD
MMKNRRKLVRLGILLTLFLGGCSERIQEETVVMAVGKETNNTDGTETKLPVIKDFMPNLNFVPRSNIPTHIVLHFISNAAKNPENPYVYEELRNTFIEYDVSPHYIIDRSGKIYYLLPESRAAQHAGKGTVFGYPDYKDHLNRYSIGIELMAIGTEKEMASIMSAEHYKKIRAEHIGYTNAQYEALDTLLEDIVSRHKQIKRDRQHIIGHNEYAPERKTDPGSLFDWSQVLGKP